MRDRVYNYRTLAQGEKKKRFKLKKENVKAWWVDIRQEEVITGRVKEIYIVEMMALATIYALVFSKMVH